MSSVVSNWETDDVHGIHIYVCMRCQCVSAACLPCSNASPGKRCLLWQAPALYLGRSTVCMAALDPSQAALPACAEGACPVLIVQHDYEGAVDTTRSMLTNLLCAECFLPGLVCLLLSPFILLSLPSAKGCRNTSECRVTWAVLLCLSTRDLGKHRKTCGQLANLVHGQPVWRVHVLAACGGTLPLRLCSRTLDKGQPIMCCHLRQQ